MRVIVIAHNVAAEDIRKALGEWADDPRVEVHELYDGLKGPSSPKNHGLDLANARYVSLVDSDDTLEPCALDRWIRIAEAGSDFVIANRREPDGNFAPVPPVRWWRRVNLSGIKDRLVYRAAPLGLMRRERFGHLRFPVGIVTGEDVLFSNNIWFSEARIAFAFGSPGYRVHADQDERATTTVRSVFEELAWIPLVIEGQSPGMADKQERLTLALKILRTNVPDAVRNRLDRGFKPVDLEQLRELVSLVVAREPSVLQYLSKTDLKLTDKLCQGDGTRQDLNRLISERSRIRSLDALTTRSLLTTFSRHAPLRYHLAGSVLAVQGRRSNVS